MSKIDQFLLEQKRLHDEQRDKGIIIHDDGTMTLIANAIKITRNSFGGTTIDFCKNIDPLVQLFGVGDVIEFGGLDIKIRVKAQR